MRKLIPSLSLLLILCACSQSEAEVTLNSDVLQTDIVPVMMPQGKVLQDPVHGEETGFAYGALGGAGSMNASGVGYVHFFSDGAIVTLNLNIVKPPNSSSYIGWLSENEASGKFIKMSEFFSPFNDVRHGMKFETKEDISKSLFVTVSEETDKNAAAPGKVVAQGLLKKIR